ncbi:MAG TPA: 4-oxalocrotonate tautomerase [Euryarchaeota archaeon]|mgnify:CR=1 FL=1|nr:4-oxalocrotonate tautomerase [Euryarchaeota archaeon]
MPVIQVYMWEGRDAETKKKLIEGLTKAFTDLGNSKESVTVILNDIPKTNWGMKGEQVSPQ